MYETALEVEDGNYLLWGNLGSAYYWAPGEEEKADSAFKRTIEYGHSQSETMMQHDLQGLILDERFQQLLEDGNYQISE